ncbi:DUF6002 family protein [Nocardia pseudobrasiliensis]|nr:DUF6002 family protein [Nocardia pseudobrasiliensis]
MVDEDDILVHGSGSYAVGDYQPIARDHLVPVDESDDLVAVAETAMGARD